MDILVYRELGKLGERIEHLEKANEFIIREIAAIKNEIARLSEE